MLSSGSERPAPRSPFWSHGRWPWHRPRSRLVREAFERCGVLVCRGQTLSMDSQLSFSRRLGPLEDFPEEAVQKERPEFYNISNVDDAGWGGTNDW